MEPYCFYRPNVIQQPMARMCAHDHPNSLETEEVESNSAIDPSGTTHTTTHILKTSHHIETHRHLCSFSFLCCHGCFALFSDRHQLIQHKKRDKCMWNKQIKKPIIFQCNHNQCQAQFIGIGALNKHRQRVHIRPFVCRVCHKTFGTKQRLLIHERIHTKNKCEICKICKKGFVDPTTLRNHMFNIHAIRNEMVNPYICRFCLKKFNKKMGLKVHLGTHLKKEERKQFHCTFCDKGFTVKSNCNRHIKRYHIK
eukprot:309706_1